MKNDDAREIDIREEIAAPFLAALGYERGTPNNIARERTLRYDRVFLGLKKATDPPLRGRADYILSVIGAGSWVLEIKSPHEPIDTDAIEQALTYARHPEVSASYCAVLNGLRMTVHRTSQSSTEAPLADISVSGATSLAERVDNLLSPAAIKRDCSPPVVDLGKPLARGLRSYAEVVGGDVRYERCRWKSDFEISGDGVDLLNNVCRQFEGFRTTVTGGAVRRDGESRIRARLTWSIPHDELVVFAVKKNLIEIDYIALADQISDAPDIPTTFDVLGEVALEEGETVFNLMAWQKEHAPVDMTIRYLGRAIGYIADHVFRGLRTTYYCNFPVMPSVTLEMEVEGTFEVKLDRR